MTSTTTSTESRVLALLSQGLNPQVVAAAVGVSESRISQLLSDPDFAAKVAEGRYQNLSKHNERDNSYDILEDTLIEKLRDCIPLMFRPMEVLKAIQVINMAKRRGSSAPETILGTQTVVQLLMPTQIITNFTTNINNQVVRAGSQDLVTIQSGSMNSLLDKMNLKKSERQEVIENVGNSVPSRDQTTTASSS